MGMGRRSCAVVQLRIVVGISFVFYLLPRQRRENIGTGLLVAIFVFFFVFELVSWTR